ncbi:unnamed protein product [Amoebophrya sp. A25]|nr:unnamed protein product [Amoebophrya sp. A25]|eukprot:GSA25T00003812001.1
MNFLSGLFSSNDSAYPPGPRAEPDVQIPEGDAVRGARLFKLKCGQCHTLHEEGINKQGPCLFGVFGRRAGQVPDFEYTDANRSSEITWSEKHLFQYVYNPRRYIPGTRMAFLGIKDQQERGDLIAFIRENGGHAGNGDKAGASTVGAASTSPGGNSSALASTAPVSVADATAGRNSSAISNPSNPSTSYYNAPRSSSPAPVPPNAVATHKPPSSMAHTASTSKPKVGAIPDTNPAADCAGGGGSGNPTTIDF